jgi:hypothetical protein
MKNDSASHNEFEAEVVGRFGILSNFFRSAQAAPELVQQLWGFARAGHLDNPMLSVFRERLFVWLSRFCPGLSQGRRGSEGGEGRVMEGSEGDAAVGVAKNGTALSETTGRNR